MSEDSLVAIYISRRSRRILVGIWSLAIGWWLVGLVALAISSSADWLRIPWMFATLVTFVAFVVSFVILMNAAIATRKTPSG